jgi:hypothetical protein
MRITDTGYVGIGCNSPAYTLDIGGNLNASGAIYNRNGSGILAYGSGSAYASNTFISTDGNGYGYCRTTGTYLYLGGGGTSTLVVTNSAMSINSGSAPATTLDVNGGVTIRNGYRPIYTAITSGTTIVISSSTYGTHYNITTSAITGVTIPSTTWSTDSNAYWVFRNNTGSYLSITFTYSGAYNTAPTNPVVIPPLNSVTLMATYYGGGTNSNYVLF